MSDYAGLNSQKAKQCTEELKSLLEDNKDLLPGSRSSTARHVNFTNTVITLLRVAKMLKLF